MRFGQLVTALARDNYKCRQCEEEIPKGSHYIFLNYVNVGPGKISFVQKLHRDCLWGWLETKEEEKRSQIRERKVKKEVNVGGRPQIHGTPEQMKKRRYLQVYMSMTKDSILKAYKSGNRERIKRRWLHLAGQLEEYGNPELVGDFASYKLGEEIGELVVQLDSPLYWGLVACDRSPGAMATAIRAYWTTKALETTTSGGDSE